MKFKTPSYTLLYIKEWHRTVDYANPLHATYEIKVVVEIALQVLANGKHLRYEVFATAARQARHGGTGILSAPAVERFRVGWQLIKENQVTISIAKAFR